MIGITPYMQKIISGVLNAIIYLREMKIKHNSIGSLSNIVFPRGDIPMLHNFHTATLCDGTDITSDLNGVADLVDLIINACALKKNNINVEMRSLLKLLRTFPAGMDPAVIISHPALLTAEKRTLFVYRMGQDLSLGQARWEAFNTFVSEAGDPAPSLSDWKATAEVTPCLKSWASSSQYLHEPASLGNFIYNSWKHMNDKQNVVKYPDEELEKIFGEAFPNFFVCWWFHSKRINDSLLNYDP